jgi:hypothetical protein
MARKKVAAERMIRQAMWIAEEVKTRKAGTMGPAKTRRLSDSPAGVQVANFMA